MYKAVVFDLDGTLTDTITTIAYYGNNALKAYGYPEIDVNMYKIFVGDGTRILVKRMMDYVGEDSPEIYEKVFKMYCEEYDKDTMYLTTVYDGMQELLKELKARGMKLGVVSNKPHFTMIDVLKNFFGEDMFDGFYGVREGVPVKPDPVSLLQILDDFGVKPTECIYVGDTKTDMMTGKNAGAYTVGVLWGFRDRAELEEHKADAIVEKPCEILGILE